MVVGGININPPPPRHQQVLRFMSLHSFFYVFLPLKKKKIFMVGLCSIVISNPFTSKQGWGGGVGKACLNFTVSRKRGG